MKNKQNKLFYPGLTIICLLFLAANLSFVNAWAEEPSDDMVITAAGKPAEGQLDVFLGESAFLKQILYTQDDIAEGVRVRGPNIAVAVDGTVMARGAGHLRLSYDAGRNYGKPQEAPFRTLLVDENSGDILSVQLHNEDKLWRSTDHGKTWKDEKIILKPNDVMKWIDETGIMKRVPREDAENIEGGYWLHTGAAESGITLRHGEKKGRLLNTATFRPYSDVHPSHRDPEKAIYSTAIYSDDGGKTWQVSQFFPESYTEEATLAELHDGRIYYNSRSHRSMARVSRDLLREEDNWRRIAWSYDGGETWEDLEISSILPDGGGYGLGYGMMGGLVRLPVKDRDILIFSNTDTGGGEREKMTVWASFDGGESWPLKRLVYAGPSAYSSLAAGRPDTISEGFIYLQFEGGEAGRYTAIQVARFNLAWLLEGELTGDGEVPNLESW